MFSLFGNIDPKGSFKVLTNKWTNWREEKFIKKVFDIQEQSYREVQEVKDAYLKLGEPSNEEVMDMLFGIAEDLNNKFEEIR